MTAAEWARICADIKATWPTATLPPETFKRWFMLLADLSGSSVATAVNELGVSHRFAPSVAEIRAVANCEQHHEWAGALADLERACRSVGVYREPPVFADPALAAIVERHGWARLCGADMRDTTWRAQFRDEYTARRQALADRTRHELAVRTTAALPAGR